MGFWAYEAEAKNIPIKSQRSFFKGSATAMIEGELEGFFQVISERNSGKILGAQIIGPDATELIHVGLTALLTLQALVNMAVVIGLVPTKGLPLPFLSYGGTSMVMTLAALGALLALSRRPAVR